jgi:peptidoglycan L-alanyl-D-glutamate endopeptidase CwlK
MNYYTESSRSRLDSCEPGLVQVFEYVLPVFDHTVLEGARTFARQKLLYHSDPQRTKTLISKHVVTQPGELSEAVDVVPHPFTWDFEGELLAAVRRGDPKETRRILHHIQRWSLFVGHVLMAAYTLGVPLRWGGDWDGDKDLADQRFDDWPHFETLKGR